MASAEAAIPGPASYSASWSSVDQHPPAAEWFQDAKFGIYFHWGAFSVPAYSNEWHPCRMRLLHHPRLGTAQDIRFTPQPAAGRLRARLSSGADGGDAPVSRTGRHPRPPYRSGSPATTTRRC
ncbi:alpha-L-fucosidase [Micromonospora schwarzwaldensis]|uniref:alpha-L-fucosidase n=1 Tax=Micromonospora sp. DSM 45708 TaxID=3111767 RepID=UPI0031D45350